ncbi:MAG: hypothetical protein PVG66_12725 [Chromatiales bacterium]|jgi:hypothetical protein
MENEYLEAKRVWAASTAIAVLGIILLILGYVSNAIPETGIILLTIITVIAGLHSLWLLAMFLSGALWGIASSINPIITIIAVIIFPPLTIPLFIGWYADKIVNTP